MAVRRTLLSRPGTSSAGTELELRGVTASWGSLRGHATSTTRTVTALVALDGVIALAAALMALFLPVGERGGPVAGLVYPLLVATFPAVWLLATLLAGAYDRRLLVVGPDEFRRILNAGIWLFAGIALLDFVVNARVSRAFVGLAVLLATLLTLVGRAAARRVIGHRLGSGHPFHRMVVLGSRSEVSDLTRHIRRCPRGIYEVVAACVDTDAASIDLPDGPVPVAGRFADAIDAARRLGADTLAVAGPGTVGSRRLRELSWDLEGTGIQLVVAPAITELAGPRIVVRPMDGLPLLHVEEPEFRGARRVVKAVIDRCGAVVLTLLMAPLVAAIALAIRLTTRGPVIYRQERLGRHGHRFMMWKFRTMVDGADRLDVWHLNEHDGPLFKVRRDPRVTPIGRWLRRTSLDELPQLWNVITGSMSLVGPRPPIPHEAELYGDDVRRRLLVKPGMTGLWQVSGRSNLSWEEAVRLDLYYIENWSVGMDAVLLWRTIAAVVRGHGAY